MAPEDSPWLLMIVTNRKISVIARVQEHFNSRLFLVNTGSTGTDLYHCLQPALAPVILCVVGAFTACDNTEVLLFEVLCVH